MIRLSRTLVTAFVLGVAVAGCATARTGNPFEGSGGGEARSERTYRLQAMNPSFMDVTIFAVSAYSRGDRVRVGRLGSTQERTFEFRAPSGSREIRFELEYFTGPTCLTGSIVLVPGDLVQLTLPVEPRNEPGCR